MNTTRSAPPTLNQLDHKRFEILERVTLSRAIDTDAGNLPRGSSGTIVYAYDNDRAYEVEFERPFHVVATVEVGGFVRADRLG